MAKPNQGTTVVDNEQPETKPAGPVCLICKEEPFYSEDGKGWKCSKAPGKHKMPPITFYDLGASHVQNIRDRRMYAPTIWLVPAEETVGNNGKFLTKPGVVAQFEQGGTLTTDDPELQFHLFRKGSLHGPEGLKRWREVYLTPEQRLNVAKDELAAVERKIQEGNSLLAAEQAKRQANG